MGGSRDEDNRGHAQVPQLGLPRFTFDPPRQSPLCRNPDSVSYESSDEEAVKGRAGRFVGRRKEPRVIADHQGFATA
jgi:hypothetical protein